MPANTTNSPTYKDFLTKAQTVFGLDPNQIIDVNDPMTKLTMAIMLTTLEQGRNNYSYDQFIKGIAKGTGIQPSVLDQEINATSLAVENNSGSAGFVSPASSGILSGGASVGVGVNKNGLYISASINAGINLNTGVNIGGIAGFSTTVSPNGVTSTYAGNNISAAAPVYYNGTNGDYAAILNTIKAQESSGNYGAVNYTAVKVGFPSSIDTSNMTLSEVRAYQQSMLNAGASSSAIGPYQTIGTTLDTWATKAGITPDTKMTPEVWDKVGAAGVESALKATGGRVDLIPNVWYTGNVQGNSNYATPQQVAAYRSAWNAQYAKQAAKIDNTQVTTKPPDGYENATVTKNSDGSTTYTKSDGTSTTVAATTQPNTNAQLPPGADSWTIRNDGPNGSAVFYATDSKTGNFIKPDGSIAMTTREAVSVQSQENNTAITNTGTIQVSALPDPAGKLTDPPTANQLGVSSTWTQEVTRSPDGQFSTVRYTNPANPGEYKQVDFNGKVSDANGELGNVLGTPYVINSVPPAAALGLGDGTQINPSVNSNGIITRVQYTSPDNVIRIVDPATGTVRDSDGIVLGRLTGKDVQTNESAIAQLESIGYVQNEQTGKLDAIVPDAVYQRNYTFEQNNQNTAITSVTDVNNTNSGIQPQSIKLDNSQAVRDLNSRIDVLEAKLNDPNISSGEYLAARAELKDYEKLTQLLIPQDNKLITDNNTTVDNSTQTQLSPMDQAVEDFKINNGAVVTTQTEQTAKVETPIISDTSDPNQSAYSEGTQPWPKTNETTNITDTSFAQGVTIQQPIGAGSFGLSGISADGIPVAESKPFPPTDAAPVAGAVSTSSPVAAAQTMGAPGGGAGC
jgi:hypothetical protein